MWRAEWKDGHREKLLKLVIAQRDQCVIAFESLLQAQAHKAMPEECSASINHSGAVHDELTSLRRRKVKPCGYCGDRVVWWGRLCSRVIKLWSRRWIRSWPLALAILILVAWIGEPDANRPMKYKVRHWLFIAQAVTCHMLTDVSVVTSSSHALTVPGAGLKTTKSVCIQMLMVA